MNHQFGFAVVGCGHIGKRHIAMINNNSACRLIGICDIKPIEDLGISNLDIPFFNDLDLMLEESGDIDVVCIATPNGLHEEQALKAIKKGYHVIVEKPMALTKKGCEHIIYEALHRHRHVFCVMQNRYSPPSLWLKEIINKGILGKIYLVQINCYWNRDERYYKEGSWHGTKLLDGGTLFTQFSHFIDIMYWLLGDVENIQTRLRDFSHGKLTEFEDSGFVSFDFVNGGMGCLNYSTSAWNNNLESSITIIAEKGSVKVGGQYMNEVEICNIHDYKMPVLPPSNPPNDYGPYKGSAANHHYVYENVVNVLLGKEAITTNALEGLKVVEIIEKIYSAEPRIV